MTRLIYLTKAIDRKHIIQTLLILIIFMTSMALPSTKMVAAGGQDDILLNVGGLNTLDGELARRTVSEPQFELPDTITFRNDNVGFYVPGQLKWYLKNNQTDGWTNFVAFKFGGPSGSLAISGDWDNDGVDTVGFYVPSQGKWYLKNNQTDGWTDFVAFNFAGPTGSIPVAGDWDNDGVDTVGFYVPSQGKWYLKNNQINGWNDYLAFNFAGPSGSQPVAGDWDNDGVDTVGFYVPSQGKWYLKNNQINGWNNYLAFNFAGPTGSIPVAGDWNNDGWDTVGFYVPSQGKWYLKNNHLSGWTNYVAFNFGGPTGSQPVAGDWDGQEAAYTDRVIEQISIAAGATGSTTAYCPSGSIVVSGGYATSPYVLVNSHSKSGNGWRAYAKNNSGDSEVLNVSATCLFNVPGSTTQVMNQVSVPSMDNGNPVAACPSGSVVTGGGWASPSDGSLRIDNSDKESNGWQVEADNSSGSSELLSAYAICLSGVSASILEVVTSINIDPGNTGAATPTCATGYLVTGGGFASQPDLVMYNTTPHPEFDQWWTYAWNPGSITRTLFGYVECLSFP